MRDLERTVRDFDALLGAGPWRGYVFGADTGRDYHGQPADWSARLVLNDRRPQFELIEPLTGPNIHADRLDSRGESMHHVAYAVASVEETTPRWPPRATP